MGSNNYFFALDSLSLCQKSYQVTVISSQLSASCFNLIAPRLCLFVSLPKKSQHAEPGTQNSSAMSVPYDTLKLLSQSHHPAPHPHLLFAPSYPQIVL